MIRETALMLTDPFLIAREMAEDAFDHRFKEAEVDCIFCERGLIGNDRYGWTKCGRCQGGSIYTALCIRCGKPETGKEECACNVADFMQ